uniref:Uncharacterized protein n=1 Tax=Cacopsylla melanoneura TaxID=428564 RepID=A0A8D8WPV8_9HEMI
MQSQSNWILLVLCYFQSKGTFGARTFSPWELKDVWFKMEQKNKEKFNFDSIVREQLEKERQELAYDENGEVKLIRHTYTTHKSTTFYGPYYMYKGKVYKRKSYTKEPTVRSNVYVTRKSFSRRNITPALTKKYFPQYKPWSSTSYMNKSTFYGPYYMYKGNLSMVYGPYYIFTYIYHPHLAHIPMSLNYLFVLLLITIYVFKYLIWRYLQRLQSKTHR